MAHETSPEILILDLDETGHKIKEWLSEGGYRVALMSGVVSGSIERDTLKGIIVSERADSIPGPYGKNGSSLHNVFDMKKSVLAIGKAMYKMIQHFGGSIHPISAEQSLFSMQMQKSCRSALFVDTEDEQSVWAPIRSPILNVPAEFTVSARRKENDAATLAIECAEQRLWGIDFDPTHPHTLFGPKLLRNFAEHCCGCTSSLPRPREQRRMYGMN